MLQLSVILMDTVFAHRSTVFDPITELSLQSHSQTISQAYDYRPCNIIYFLIITYIYNSICCGYTFELPRREPDKYQQMLL